MSVTPLPLNGTGGNLSQQPAAGTKAILERTLAELEARRDKLQPFVDDYKEAEGAIRVIERAIGLREPQRRGAGGTPAPERCQQILDMLRSEYGTVSPREVADALDIGFAYASQLLKAMATDDDLVRLPGKRAVYGLPVQVDTEGEHAEPA